jgi:hypothetical protein
MAMLEARMHVGDKVRVVSGEFAGETGRIGAVDRDVDGEWRLSVFLGESRQPSLPLSEVRLQPGGLLGTLLRLFRPVRSASIGPAFDTDAEIERMRNTRIGMGR